MSFHDHAWDINLIYSFETSCKEVEVKKFVYARYFEAIDQETKTSGKSEILCTYVCEQNTEAPKTSNVFGREMRFKSRFDI